MFAMSIESAAKSSFLLGTDWISSHSPFVTFRQNSSKKNQNYSG
ncbi:hypothetical protein JCM19238_5631 [Vibrio ponticus]|nr:hypothetical protein JCM19238_5631 [Vibrio ponticus]